MYSHDREAEKETAMTTTPHVDAEKAQGIVIIIDRRQFFAPTTPMNGRELK